jgi:hypothetical protein
MIIMAIDWRKKCGGIDVESKYLNIYIKIKATLTCVFVSYIL